MDMIFAAREIQEKCKEQNMDIYDLFVDLTKAFTYNVSSWAIENPSEEFRKLVNIIRWFYEVMKARLVNGCKNDEFSVTNEVKQGC